MEYEVIIVSPSTPNKAQELQQKEQTTRQTTPLLHDPITRAKPINVDTQWAILCRYYLNELV